MPETEPQATTACEDEPIHAPGAIQPHGVLLGLEPDGLTVLFASDNCRAAFGRGPDDLPGGRVGELLGPAAEAALRDGGPDDSLPVPVALAGWYATGHRRGDTVFLELEPDCVTAACPLAVLASVRKAARRLSAAATTPDLCDIAAREVRRLTGYDRVMVYRFDEEWNGQVVAEEMKSGLEPYLGLHYPASDIPAQARALYLANRLRVVPDAAYESVPVTPDRDGRTGRPWDLGRCQLRSVSPVHLEYLHNMGVRATLTASLVVSGRLWGLVACHHLTPKCPGPAERDACDLLAEMASAHLASRADSEDQGSRAAIGEALARVGTRAGGTNPPVAALLQDEGDLLALAGADGAVVWRSGRGVAVGRTPPPESLAGLIGWVKAAASPVVVTDRLGRKYPPATSFTDVASGMMAVELSRDPDEFVFWFRPEVLQTVSWGGNPHASTGRGERLSPRRSFAAWVETVRGRSLPWRPAEVEAAGQLRSLVTAAELRSVVRMETLLPICAWCKKVRDEPGYWRRVEDFIGDLVDVRLTHAVCPECLARELAEFAGHKPSGC